MIPYSRQSISEEDIQAVVDVLRSDFLTFGPGAPAFEDAIATKVGVDHAVVVNSATSALHLACVALDVGPGDVVWTSPNSFVASANCARFCGAEVDFVDIDPQTLCMDPMALESKLLDCQKTGKKLPKVIIPVHFSGHSCDMPLIHALSERYGIRIIEDASHAIGSKVKFSGHPTEEYVGNCRYSDICVFSFHPVKIVTTAEGGAALTRSRALAHRLRALRSHGVTREPGEMTEPTHGMWYYQMLELGLNYRLTDVQAALGISQLKRLDTFVLDRQRIAAQYENTLALPEFACPPLGIVTQVLPPYCSSAFHLFVVQVPERARRVCFDRLRECGFGVNVHYIPIHTQPYYQRRGFRWGDFPHSESYYRRAISLPIFPGMPTDVPRRVIDALAGVLREQETSKLA